MQRKWLFGISAVGLLFLFFGMAGAWWLATGRTPLRFSPPPQPQIAWVEFARGDGSEPPIRLAGHWSNVQIESLFAGFRDEATTGFELASDARWIVTIVQTDGRKSKLAVRSQGRGYAWQAGETSHPIQGDLELFLQAHQGIQILNLASSAAAADRLRLEEAVANEGDAALNGLLALAHSMEDHPRAIALRALNMTLSPRLRREARLAAGLGEAVPSDVPRAADHPRAAEVRELAVSLLDAWRADPAATSYSMAERAMFETLVELRDQDIADRLAAVLRQRPNADYRAERIMQVLEQVYGLPPVVEPLYFCATGESPASIARAEAKAHSRRQQRRVLLLAWHDLHRGLPREAQLQAAVAAWEPIIAERQPHYLVGHPITMQSTFRPLFVQGTDVLPALADAQQRASDLSRQAVYEALITIINGQRDDAFLAELMQGDPIQREMAGKIMAIPTSN